ncbi:hypothetical protein [Streptomyces sp. ITFR-6]|uniref:hypothetical protein n=1 Tax=Streptomyces sp. ITFR-6 TaxID=3075197 RepID=UPI00288A0AD9|nr:hypothetical protein [Streptomyces sp. ITFR-6]WNI33894.1 hypothetical protein RLT59_37720 [Streptomyces sp. ITFR-6]
MRSWRSMERRLWPASSIAWTVACLARMRLANQSLFGKWPATHRNAVWEGDHKHVPVEVDVAGELVTPWGTWFIGCATKAITGVAVTAHAPSREAVLASSFAPPLTSEAFVGLLLDWVTSWSSRQVTRPHSTGELPLQAWQAGSTPLTDVSTGQLATFALEDNGRTYTISTSGVRWRRRDYLAHTTMPNHHRQGPADHQAAE